MSVLSVPLTKELETAIENLLNWGVASNKADAARKAILKMEEDAAISVVLQSKQEIKDGKIIESDLSAFL